MIGDSGTPRIEQHQRQEDHHESSPWRYRARQNNTNRNWREPPEEDARGFEIQSCIFHTGGAQPLRSCGVGEKRVHAAARQISMSDIAETFLT